MATADTKPVNSLSPLLVGVCATGIMAVAIVATLIIRDIVADPVSAAQSAAVVVAVTPPKPPATTPPDSVAVATPPDAPEPQEPPVALANEVAALSPPVAPAIEPEEELVLPEAKPVAPAFLVPQTDYFSLLRENLTVVMDNIHHGKGDPYRFIEVAGPEGIFTVCFSKYGYWNGSSGNKMEWSDELRDRGYVYVTLLTPGGNPIAIGWRKYGEKPPLYEIRFSQTQTLFGLNFKVYGYTIYDSAFDELKEVSWVTENKDAHRGRVGFQHIPEIKVGNYYLYFYRHVRFHQEKLNDFPPNSISGMWGTFEGIQTLNPDTLHATRYWYGGPETGVLKEATLDGEDLILIFAHNTTRDLKLTFSPNSGFSKAEPIKAKN